MLEYFVVDAKEKISWFFLSLSNISCIFESSYLTCILNLMLSGELTCQWLVSWPSNFWKEGSLFLLILFFSNHLHLEATSQNLFSSHTLKRPTFPNGMLVYVHWGDDTEVGKVFTVRSDNTWRGARWITEETWTSLVKHISLSTCLPNGDVDFDIVIPLFMKITYINLFSNIYSPKLII